MTRITEVHHSQGYEKRRWSMVGMLTEHGTKTYHSEEK
jgi:hypothetical protein